MGYYVGTGGNDSLTGTDVDDTLDGAAGADTMSGGNGSDTYIVDNVGDRCVETTQGVFGDFDRIIASVTYTLPAYIDILRLTGSAIGGIGNDANNSIVGNSEANQLVGGAGDDTLDGSWGNDIFDGGTGTDTVDYRYWNFGLDVNLSTGLASLEGGFNEPLTSIENIIAGNGNDSLRGSVVDNKLSGGGGNDTLNGGGGDDTLDGGLGNDVLVGSTGVQTLEGWDGDDFFDLNGMANIAGSRFFGDDGIDTVDLAQGSLQLGSVLRFFNIERLDVYLTQFRGTTEADTYDFRPFETIGFGAPLNMVVYAGDGGDLVYSTNTVVPSGSHMLYGEAGNDTLYGGASGDWLIGGDGADSLDGGASKDLLSGGAGNDVLVATAGDTLAGGADIDTLVMTGLSVNLVVDLAAGTSNVFSASGGFENASAGSGNDSIVGTAGQNTLAGSGGNDTLVGGAGADLLQGGDGNDRLVLDGADTLAGGNGIDTLYLVDDVGPEIATYDLGAASFSTGAGVTISGFEHFEGSAADELVLGSTGANRLAGRGGSDTLAGGSGNDILDGGIGADQLRGGAGADTYYIDSTADVIIEAGTVATEIDTVRSSVSWLLGTSLENLVLTGTAARGTGNTLANAITGNDAANWLAGAGGSDSIKAVGGNDTLVGGAGNDTLYGGAGLDKFRFAATLSASSNVDRVADFVSADDTFQLDDAYFAHIGPVGTLAPGAFRLGVAAADSSDRILYDSAHGRLLFDADGNGAGAAILFATVVPGIAVSAANFVIV